MRPPVRDPKYLKFIRQFPCVGCKTQRWGRDAMHIGPHGIGQKASDLDTLPGCRKCHRELHKIGARRFQERYAVDFAAMIRMFRRFFVLKHPGHEWVGATEKPELIQCPCGYEDFREEFAVCGGCPVCGQKEAA